MRSPSSEKSKRRSSTRQRPLAGNVRPPSCELQFPCTKKRWPTGDPFSSGPSLQGGARERGKGGENPKNPDRRKRDRDKLPKTPVPSSGVLRTRVRRKRASSYELSPLEQRGPSLLQGRARLSVAPWPWRCVWTRRRYPRTWACHPSRS